MLLLLAFMIIVMPVACTLTVQKASADEWFGYPILEWGVEKASTANGIFFCQDPNDYVGNQAVKLPVYRHKGFALMASAHHHSCLAGADEPSYDAFGFQMQFDSRYLFE